MAPPQLQEGGVAATRGSDLSGRGLFPPWLGAPAPPPASHRLSHSSLQPRKVASCCIKIPVIKESCNSFLSLNATSCQFHELYFKKHLCLLAVPLKTPFQTYPVTSASILDVLYLCLMAVLWDMSGKEFSMASVSVLGVLRCQYVFASHS